MCYGTQTQTFSPTKHPLSNFLSITTVVWWSQQLLVRVAQISLPTLNAAPQAN